MSQSDAGSSLPTSQPPGGYLGSAHMGRAEIAEADLEAANRTAEHWYRVAQELRALHQTNHVWCERCGSQGSIVTAGSGVPEAARAAAREAFLRGVAERGYMDGGPIDDGLAAAAPILVAAAVAEERATTGRRIEAAAQAMALAADDLAGLRSPAEHAYRACASSVRAALASPGESE